MPPGCGNTMCLLTTFKKLLKNVTLENFKEDCGDRVDFQIVK